MFNNNMINRKSSRPNSMTNNEVKCIWCNKLNEKIEELQFENEEHRESITDQQDKNEEQQCEIDKNLFKNLRLESKSKKNFEKLKIVSEELKTVKEELKIVKDGIAYLISTCTRTLPFCAQNLGSNFLLQPACRKSGCMYGIPRRYRRQIASTSVL